MVWCAIDLVLSCTVPYCTVLYWNGAFSGTWLCENETELSTRDVSKQEE